MYRGLPGAGGFLRLNADDETVLALRQAARDAVVQPPPAPPVEAIEQPPAIDPTERLIADSMRAMATLDASERHAQGEALQRAIERAIEIKSLLTVTREARAADLTESSASRPCPISGRFAEGGVALDPWCRAY